MTGGKTLTRLAAVSLRSTPSPAMRRGGTKPEGLGG